MHPDAKSVINSYGFLCTHSYIIKYYVKKLSFIESIRIAPHEPILCQMIDMIPSNVFKRTRGLKPPLNDQKNKHFPIDKISYFPKSMFIIIYRFPPIKLDAGYNPRWFICSKGP